MNMEDRELDRQVKQAFDGLTPDIFDSVLTDCRMQSGKVVSMKPRRKGRLLRSAAGIAAALLLMGIVGFSPSVTRAGIAVLILNTGTLLLQPGDPLTALAIAVLLTIS